MKIITLCILGTFAILVTSCGKMIPHYKIDIEQGNVLTKEVVNRIRPGMTKRQVKFILGTPIIASSFHKHRWDYVYSLKKGGKKKITTKTMSLFFLNDRIVRIEGSIKPEFSDQPVQKQTTKVVEVNPEKKKKKGIFRKALGKVGIGNDKKRQKKKKKKKKKKKIVEKEQETESDSETNYNQDE